MDIISLIMGIVGVVAVGVPVDSLVRAAPVLGVPALQVRIDGADIAVDTLDETRGLHHDLRPIRGSSFVCRVLRGRAGTARIEPAPKQYQ